MKELKYFSKYLLDVFIVVFMYIIKIICPIYIVYAYKKAIKARQVVYDYWMLYNQKYFYQYFNFDINNIVNEDGIYYIIINRDSYKYIFTYKKINKFKYYWWFYTVWIWLDDVTLINGMNKSLYNKGINIKAIPEQEKIKIYKNIFSHNYFENSRYGDISLPKTNDLLFYIKETYTNNYERLFCYLEKPTFQYKDYGYVKDTYNGRYMLKAGKYLVRRIFK